MKLLVACSGSNLLRSRVRFARYSLSCRAGSTQIRFTHVGPCQPISPRLRCGPRSANRPRRTRVGHYIGLDLGGTNIKGGLLDEAGTTVAQRSIPTESHGGPGHVMDRLNTLARQLADDATLEWDRVDGIGVGTPGPLGDGDVVLSAPNLPGWKNVPLGAGMTERTKRPVAIVNDADAAAFGEFWTGAGAGESIQHMILLTLGTGIGGGVIINGKLFSGAHRAGAELGHVIVEPQGRPCGCGQVGCIERYASASAVANEAKRRLGAGEASSLTSIDEVSCRAVFEAAEAGDAMALSVVEEACDKLGTTCVNLVRIFDPQMIVFGGGMAHAGDALLSRVRATFDRRTWHVREERVTLTLATLFNDAGFIGAAGMARAELGA
ncbi:MAG: ROK family protein [Phycisphaera sp.]|nr:ROK family protein [Phycisphaera sp.]